MTVQGVPQPRDGNGAILETAHRPHVRQAVPEFDELAQRPILNQAQQFRLAGEGDGSWRQFAVVFIGLSERALGSEKVSGFHSSFSSWATPGSEAGSGIPFIALVRHQSNSKTQGQSTFPGLIERRTEFDTIADGQYGSLRWRIGVRLAEHRIFLVGCGHKPDIEVLNAALARFGHFGLATGMSTDDLWAAC